MSNIISGPYESYKTNFTSYREIEIHESDKMIKDKEEKRSKIKEIKKRWKRSKRRKEAQRLKMI